MQPHVLIPGGKSVESHMDFVKLGHVGIGTIAFGEAMRVDVEAVDGYHLLMFCLSGEARVRTRRSTISVDRTNAVFCATGEPFDAMLSPRCEQFIVRIDAGALGSRFRQRGLSPHLQIDRPELVAWLQQLNLIARSPSLLELARTKPDIGKQFGRLLIELLCAAFQAPGHESGAEKLSPKLVKRAKDYIHERGHEALTLADIASALDVPERTLRDGFRHFLGTSPMRYLRTIRLERTRHALLNAPDGMHVSDIALDNGFSHLGRFSLEYKAYFGESPSETLARR
jgi:AraC-like DNA-binding protein